MNTYSELVSPELRQEKFFRLLFMNSPLPMWVFCTTSLRFSLVNDAAVKLYGYTREEFLQMTVQEVAPPSKLFTLFGAHKELKGKTGAAGEKVHVKKDGTLLFVLESSKPLPPEKEVTERMVIIQEMSALRKLALPACEAEKPVLDILHKVEEVVFSFNGHMEMTYISPQCFALTGYVSEHFYQGPLLWFNLVHPQDRHLFEEAIQKNKKGRKRFQFEHRIRTASGEEKWVLTKCFATLDQKEELIRLDGSIHDITERKQEEERLKFVELSFENSAEPFLWIRQDGQISRSNKAASTFLGYQEEEFQLLKFYDISPSLDMQVWQSHWQAFEQLKSLSIETMIQAKNGQLHPVEIHWSYFPYKEETYSFTIIREIAERKKSESEKAHLTEKTLKQVEHLQQFANIVSHNLSRPVANLVGLTNLYNRQNLADPNNLVIIDKLERTTHYLDSAIHDLNEILTIRSQTDQLLEVVDLQQGFLEAREWLALQLVSSKASLTADFSKGATVLGVKSYISSIFFNLISNSVKYRSPHRPLEIYISTLQTHQHLCLLVRDNGLGIDLEKQGKKIFGLYRRFHPNIDGKGLGLHMSKTQVESMGGYIDVESTVDVGTVFKVYFQVPVN
ncbi:PAS domain-containing sensor histidine kinase [Rufibacter immobilis]|nr:PAS domain S-box protein [Rufibacter immobilis]